MQTFDVCYFKLLREDEFKWPWTLTVFIARKYQIKSTKYLFWHYILNNILVDDLMQQSPLGKVAVNIKNKVYSHRV